MDNIYFSVKKEDDGTFTILDSDDNELVVQMTKEDMERLALLLTRCVEQKNWKK